MEYKTRNLFDRKLLHATVYLGVCKCYSLLLWHRLVVVASTMYRVMHQGIRTLRGQNPSYLVCLCALELNLAANSLKSSANFRLPLVTIGSRVEFHSRIFFPFQVQFEISNFRERVSCQSRHDTSLFETGSFRNIVWVVEDVPQECKFWCVNYTIAFFFIETDTYSSQISKRIHACVLIAWLSKKIFLHRQMNSFNKSWKN